MLVLLVGYVPFLTLGQLLENVLHYSVVRGNRIIWMWTETGSRLLWMQLWIFRFHKYGEFLDLLRTCKLLKKVSTSWRLFVSELYYFLTCWGPVSFSRRSLLHGVCLLVSCIISWLAEVLLASQEGLYYSMAFVCWWVVLFILVNTGWEMFLFCNLQIKAPGWTSNYVMTLSEVDSNMFSILYQKFIEF
jgi:hypothetical protein